MMSAFKKQRKSLCSKLKIKNQINVIDAFLSSSLLTLNTFIQFIKPISCQCSISMPPRKYPKTFGFLTFLVFIKLVHQREMGCFINLMLLRAYICHVSGLSPSPNSKGIIKIRKQMFLTLQCLVFTKGSHILIQTSSQKLQVCLCMCDLLVGTK